MESMVLRIILASCPVEQCSADADRVGWNGNRLCLHQGKQSNGLIQTITQGGTTLSLPRLMIEGSQMLLRASPLAHGTGTCRSLKDKVDTRHWTLAGSKPSEETGRW